MKKIDLYMCLTSNNKSNINSWKKNLNIDQTDDYTWILEHTSDIAKFIETYKSKSCKRNHYILLAKMCKLLGNKKKHDIYEKHYKSIVLVKKKKDNDPKISKLVTWNNLMILRKKYKDDSAKSPDNYKLHMKYLIICLLTYQPPIASLYDDLHIIYTKPEINSNNYLWIKSKTDFRLVINKDRVLKESDDVVVKIESKSLMNIISSSLKTFERPYLLTLVKDKNKPLQIGNFTRLMKEIGLNMSIEIFRSAYVVQCMSNKTMDEYSLPEKHDRRHLAKQMRLTYISLLNKFTTLKKQYAKKAELDKQNDSDED